MPVDEGNAVPRGVPGVVFQPPEPPPASPPAPGRTTPAPAPVPEVSQPDAGATGSPAGATPSPTDTTGATAGAPGETGAEAGEAGEAPAAPEREIVALSQPRDGVPDVIVDEQVLLEYVARLKAGTGPLAVDAERASGHRYGQRAFLVQVRREGASTALIDPVSLPDLSALGTEMADVEWIIHAASQDLPCLLTVGMHPGLLFDTELGGRLAGLPRVGLAAMTQELLGLSLAKEHSAVDWSTRPLPEPWLRYAALDVEVLVELRDAVAERLEEQGKLGWAQEEFAYVAAMPPPPPRVDPWRRTSGMHRIRDRRRLAAVRELWTMRDSIAQQRDISPGRVLPDSAIVEAATAMPSTVTALMDLPGFSGRGAGRHARAWQQALQLARALPEAELPAQHLPADGPPPPRVWAERDPAAAARLTAARAALNAICAEHQLPVENLLSPDSVRRLAWQPPEPHDPAAVAEALRASGAREWQIGLAADALATALDAVPTPT